MTQQENTSKSRVQVPRKTDRNGEIPVENLDKSDPVDCLAYWFEVYAMDYRPIWRVSPYSYKRAQFLIEKMREAGFIK